MKINYQPTTDTENVAIEIQNIIAEKFPQTYFVGGFVRDILLERKITDVDLATEALPEQICELIKNSFEFSDKNKNFGIITVNPHIEIATFRVESYTDSRYPKVAFINSVEADSLRRDFTINSLYMSREGEILDFHDGMADLGKGLLRFIGNPEKKIHEDPLRIARAIRFAIQLEFKIEYASAAAINQNFSLLQNLSDKLLQTEMQKLSFDQQKKFKIIINSEVLDESLCNSYNDDV